jgi:hypothetical protein
LPGKAIEEGGTARLLGKLTPEESRRFEDLFWLVMKFCRKLFPTPYSTSLGWRHLLEERTS